LTTPSAGQIAPDFSLPAPDGDAVSLSQFRGHTVVLYFYPKAFTGGCTMQACNLRDAQPSLEAEGIKVVGVSVDDQETQKRFRDEHQLPFPVLADLGGNVARTYGVFGIQKADGSVLPEARRVTFIIGPDGTIREVIDPAHADVHLDEVRAALANV
jgi:peroxiredoxin Q/BCP